MDSGSITFGLSGAPQGKGRARFNRATGNSYTPAATRSYESMIRGAAMDAMAGRLPIEGPVAVRLTAEVDIPKSMTKRDKQAAASQSIRPSKRPDIDNIIKAFLDGMNTVVFKDDSQIWHLDAAKVYGPAAKVTVTVTPWCDGHREREPGGTGE